MPTLEPKIYLVEDNPVFQTLVKKQMEDVSRDIHVFNNGAAFLEALTATRPHLIVLDYNLEGDMNGYDILSEIKKMDNPVPVIFFSANLELSITSSILKLGVVEYIEKSIFTLSRLHNSICRWIDGSNAVVA